MKKPVRVWDADKQTYVNEKPDKITWAKIDEDAHAFLLHLDEKIMEFGELYTKLEDRVLKLEEIIRVGLGPCPECTGSGMRYYPDVKVGRDVPEPCETCKGSGKIPLDLAYMIEQIQAKVKEEQTNNNDLPF
tara:strand:+ start:357 stop:752 length:396 start_codon:yes stop_codon:yes gene_type:complete